jgi:hypothetical protein
MRDRRVIFLAALTVVGGTFVARLTRVRVPGFSPNG